jgi:tRNA G46 methylase TrmB
LLAGKSTEVTFMATLKDGGKLLAATDSDTYRDISARALKKSRTSRRDAPSESFNNGSNY